MLRLAILGAPGTGKSTQAALLAEKYQLAHISTKEILRVAMEGATPMAKLAKAIIDGGQTVNDEMSLNIIEEKLATIDMNKGFILDGYPKNVQQAELLEQMFRKNGLTLDAVFLLEMDLDALIQRIAGRRTCRECGTVFNTFYNPPSMDDQCDMCGGRLRHRADDNEETVSNRLRQFEVQTMPLLDCFSEQDILHRFDSLQSVEEVIADIDKIIESLPERSESSDICKDVKDLFNSLRSKKGDLIIDELDLDNIDDSGDDDAPIGDGSNDTKEDEQEDSNGDTSATEKKSVAKKKGAGKKRAVVKKRAAVKKKVVVKKKVAPKKKVATKKKT